MNEKVLQKTVTLCVYTSDSIPSEWADLCMRAQKAAHSAYAPYSMFRVGAAVLLEDGSIITGNNQENAAYPSGLCAERTVLFYTHAQYPDKKIQALAIYSPDAASLLTPCGACRQVLVEYENLQHSCIQTILVTNQEIYVLPVAKDWLPFEFSENILKSK